MFMLLVVAQLSTLVSTFFCINFLINIDLKTTATKTITSNIDPSTVNPTAKEVSPDLVVPSCPFPTP